MFGTFLHQSILRWRPNMAQQSLCLPERCSALLSLNRLDIAALLFSFGNHLRYDRIPEQILFTVSCQRAVMERRYLCTVSELSPKRKGLCAFVPSLGLLVIFGLLSAQKFRWRSGKGKKNLLLFLHLGKA